MNIYEIIAKAQALKDEKKIDSVSPSRVGALIEDTLKYINEYQLLSSSPMMHKTYASVSAMQADAAPVSDLTGKAMKKGQLVVIVPADSSDTTAGDVYRYDGPSGNTSAWTFISKIGGIPADAQLSATSTNPVQNAAVTAKLTELQSDLTFPHTFSDEEGIIEWNTGRLVKPNTPGLFGTYPSDYIGISEIGSKIRVSMIAVTSANTTAGLAFYDKDKKYISGVKAATNNSELAYKEMLLDVPSDAVYIRTEKWIDDITDDPFYIIGNAHLRGITEGAANIKKLDREVGKLNDIIIGPDKTLLQGYYDSLNGQYKDDEYRNIYVCLKDTIGPFRLELKDEYYIDSVCVTNADLQFYFSFYVSSKTVTNKKVELLNTEYKYRINICKVGGGEISKDEDIIKKLEIIDNPSRKEQQVSILREGYEVSPNGVIVASGVSIISPIGVEKASKVYIDYPMRINYPTDCWCAFFGKDNTILSVVKPFAYTSASAPSSFIFAIDVPADAYYIVCSKEDNTPIRVWLDEEDKSFRFIDLTRGYYQRLDGRRYTDDEDAPKYISNPQLVTPSFYVRVKDDYIIDSVTKYNNGAFNSSGYVSLESIRISINDGFTYGINIVRKDGGQIATSVLPWDIIESFGDVEGQEIDAVTFVPSDNDGTIALGLNYKMKDHAENGTRYLSMSDDNGVTWNTIENIYGDIVFVHFFLNGNVLFATSKKCYYSSDNLATIQESAVYDLDGTAFVADDADYFYQQRNYANENCVVDGTERLLWGEYYIGSVSSWRARIWETHDNGRTINCIFKYGTSQIDGQVISARHSHAVFFNKYNQKWYGLSGDDGNRCNVIEISYNGSYNFSLIGMGDNYKFANVFFDADNAYFITDYTISGTIRGILRCPIAQLRDFNNYKYIWKVDGNVPLTGYVADAVGHKFITPDGIGYNKLFFAESGLRFKRLFANFPDAKACAPDWIFGPDYNGEYYVFCWKGGYSTATHKMVLSGNLYNLSKAMEREGVILKGSRI